MIDINSISHFILNWIKKKCYEKVEINCYSTEDMDYLIFLVLKLSIHRVRIYFIIIFYFFDFFILFLVSVEDDVGKSNLPIPF